MQSFSIIFDMDGTLFQTDRILEISLEETFEHLKSRDLWDKEAPSPIETYRAIMGVPLPQVWETLLPEHSDEIRAEVDRHFLTTLIANIQKGKGALYAGTLEVLAYLKENGFPVYIASNGLKPYLAAIVRYYGLDAWVTETFSIEQIDSLDKAELVRSIIEKYGFEKGAVVGDRLSDIRAAQTNGLLAIGCRFDFAREEELAQADIVIDHLQELKTLIHQFRV
ncbi:HAD family hydrolase [Saccharibacillus endophyticus]|uniref:MTA/SAH nucleosidase n=1 Tax=Saccharibacillus endophyticus TaxID=2060666 RepID=A0ABQ1ZJK2_9BACL|nr:HAD family hydrolase [Saccharibacillus endophyticus]GGH68385.1 MTA/SAH nucleosidase [Saccharibacillus endophyticus]